MIFVEPLAPQVPADLLAGLGVTVLVAAYAITVLLIFTHQKEDM